MPLYKVSVESPDNKRGLGEATVSAADEEDAKARYAVHERTTVEDLEDLELTVWSIDEV